MKNSKKIIQYFSVALLFIFIATSVNALQVLAENKQPNATENYEGNVKPLDTLKAKVQAGDAKDDAEKALKKLIEKLKAVNKAKDDLKKAQDARDTVMAADVADGPGTSSTMEKMLDNQRAAVANAEAALEEAEAEALEALLALNEAIAKVEKEADRKALRRRLDGALRDAKNGQFALRESLEGVVTVEIKTDGGQPVNLTVPADVRPGDTISFSAETQDTATLSGAVFDIGGKEHKLLDRILTVVVPQAVGMALPIILKNSSGREIGRQQIAINKNPGSIPEQPVNVPPPRIGQTGQIVSIPTGTLGPYDGNADNTRVAFTPQSMPTASINIPVIAKSPRGTFAKIPTDIQTGPGMLTIEENGVREQFKHNVLRVKLTADKLQLKRGEGTPFRVEVSANDMAGLAEDNQEVTCILKNLSPSVVRFNSTSSNQMTVRIPKNGIINLGLTGVGAGAFTIHAFLKAMLADSPSNPRDWVRKITELKREAANQSENSKNQKELKKNADSLGKTADNKDDWDKDGQLKDKEKFKKFLEKEKKDLDEMQKRDTKGSEAWKKIGEAKDAVDKAAKAAGVKPD